MNLIIILVIIDNKVFQAKTPRGLKELNIKGKQLNMFQ